MPACGQARSYRASSRSSVAGSAPATSSIFTRLRAPATTVTELRLTPNSAATKATAAAVARPFTARSLTRTTRASSWCPPTPGRADPGRTRTVIRTPPVCAPARRAIRRGHRWLTRLRKRECLRRQSGTLQSLAERLRGQGGLFSQVCDLHGGALIHGGACHQVQVLVVVGRHPVGGLPVLPRRLGRRYL